MSTGTEGSSRSEAPPRGGRSDRERIVEVSLRIAPTPGLSTIGRVVREEATADARPRGAARERVRPGVLMAFGCVIRDPAATTRRRPASRM